MTDTVLEVESANGANTGSFTHTWSPPSGQVWYVDTVTVRANNSDNIGTSVGAGVFNPSADALTDYHEKGADPTNDQFTGDNFGDNDNGNMATAILEVEGFVTDSQEFRVEIGGGNSTTYYWSYNRRRIL